MGPHHRGMQADPRDWVQDVLLWRPPLPRIEDYRLWENRNEELADVPETVPPRCDCILKKA
jgi:hypothetical protein